MLGRDNLGKQKQEPQISSPHFANRASTQSGSPSPSRKGYSKYRDIIQAGQRCRPREPFNGKAEIPAIFRGTIFRFRMHAQTRFNMQKFVNLILATLMNIRSFLDGMKTMKVKAEFQIEL